MTQLTVFDTGEVHEPHIYTDQSGWVEFDNDESCAIIALQVVPSREEEETTVIKFDPLAGGMVALERNGERVWVGEGYLEPGTRVARTVADLDGTADAVDWLQTGHALDDQEVAYLRSLLLPTPITV
ncbi:hypothetical protein ACFVU2_19625 [Leifsonia sp. NPDC058194]|uniref:hypothetical protein n=1 Tax=Leifsonia sp. NPDC058194 TaxID=3346374 RepID=UPI0036DE3E39